MNKELQLKELVKNKRVFVAIDAANLAKSVQKSGYRIDFKRLYTYFERRSKSLHVVYYTAVFNTKSHHAFLGHLKRKIGYALVTKSVKVIVGKNGRINKANFDVEIAVDSILKLYEYDVFVLFSGDSDFAYLVMKVKEKGKMVLVISRRGYVSKELVLSSSKYLDVVQLTGILEPLIEQKTSSRRFYST